MKQEQKPSMTVQEAAQANADKVMPFIWPKNKHGEDMVQVVGAKAPPFSKKHKLAQNKLIKSFIAGADWQASQTTGLTWVKASERLPEGRGENNSVIVVGSHPSLSFVAWGFKNFADSPEIYVNIGAKSFLCVSRDANFHSTYPIEFVKWLDESQSLTPVKEDGWIGVEKQLPIRPEKKEYEDVLCGFYGPNGRFNQFVGFYAEKHKVPYEDYDGDDGEYDPVEEAHGTLYLKPGWYELEETPSGAYDEVFVQRNVTHWRPLFPAPPQSNTIG